MGDDFYYATFSDSWDNFFSEHANHYFRVNGRAAVHFIVSLFLIFDVYLWRIINPFIIMLMIWIIYKNSRTDSIYSLIISILLFFSFSVNVVRESIYWLDGSVNYLYPMLLVFITYYLYRENKASRKKIKLTALCISAFISGATMEQSGMIIIGLLLMDIIHDIYIEKNKILILQKLVLISAVLGYLTVVLAPGTFSRFGHDGINIYSFADTIKAVAMFTFYNQTAVYLHTALLLICFFWLKENNKLIRPLCFVPIAFFILKTKIEFDNDNLFFICVIIAVICVYLFLLLYTYISKYIKEKNITEISFLATGFGSQLMLVLSSVIGGRTLLAAILCLCVPVIMGLHRYKDKSILLYFVLILYLLEFNYIISLITLALFAAYKLSKIKKHDYIISILLLAVFSSIIYSSIFIAYYNNSQVHKYNLTAVQNYDNLRDSEIKLRKMRDEYAGVSFIYNSPYHETWFKRYYKIEQETRIIYTEE